MRCSILFNNWLLKLEYQKRRVEICPPQPAEEKRARVPSRDPKVCPAQSRSPAWKLFSSKLLTKYFCCLHAEPVETGDIYEEFGIWEGVFCIWEGVFGVFGIFMKLTCRAHVDRGHIQGSDWCPAQLGQVCADPSWCQPSKIKDIKHLQIWICVCKCAFVFVIVFVSMCRPFEVSAIWN